MKKKLRECSVPRKYGFLMKAIPAAVLMLGIAPSYGMTLDTDSEVTVRWDNTFKYSAAWRVKDPDQRLVANENLDDGDRNFAKGLISNRLDLLSEFDASYKNMGVRLSGAAWFDDRYNRRNDNPGGTANVFSVPQDQFSEPAKRLMGRKAELLDAFMFYNSDASSETPFSVRAGRHAILYGETLFFGGNGIAGAQSPVDVVKALAVPSSQFKEIIRPVGQVSTQIQLSQNVSAGAYYQYRWDKNRIPASGSYLADSDYVGTGAERLLVSPSAAGPGFFVTEKEARDSGQFGMQFRFKPQAWDVEFGLYAARYHDKSPQLYLRPTGLPPAAGTLSVGNLEQVYAENVKTVGASFSTVVGDTNVAGEISFRDNAPLVNDPVLVLPGRTADGRNDPLFAVGRTAHANLSAVRLMSKGGFWDAAQLLGEVAFNRTLSVTRNANALDPNTTRDAWAFRILFVPQFFQAFPGVDMEMPIGLGYNFSGRSSAVMKFNGGVDHGGDLSIGLNADFAKKWKAGASYTHFFGRSGPLAEPSASGAPQLSYDQSFKDRNFISVNIQRTF